MPSHIRHPTIEKALPSYTGSFSYAQNLSVLDAGQSTRNVRDPFTNSISHFGMSSMSAAEDHIANPSPFAIASTFSYSDLAPTPSSATTQSLSELRTTHKVHLAPDDGQAGSVATSGASMAFDAAPAFVPAPQAWTRAPLETTEDLVAYLEHRTRLARQ